MFNFYDDDMCFDENEPDSERALNFERPERRRRHETWQEKEMRNSGMKEADFFEYGD